MRRPAAAALVLLVLAVACTKAERGQFEGFRDLKAGDVIAYRVGVTQSRTSSGLGTPKTLASSVHIDLEEEATGPHAYALVVRDAVGKGEPSQSQAAERLVGRRLLVDLADGKVGGDTQAFAGTDDIPAADIAMLFVLIAPLLPSPRVDDGAYWRVVSEPVRVPWSLDPFQTTATHDVAAHKRFHDLDAVRVKSSALGNVRFRLPLVAPKTPAGSASGSGSKELIVNQLFDSLFSDIHNPIQGVAAAIAAIPLAVAAPFIALGEAIGNLFGGSKNTPSEQQVPSVDLAGPLKLRSDTLLWDADGRVLDALGTGTLKLSGTIAGLPGSASSLNGKMLTLDIVWKLHRTHTSTFPADRDPPIGVLPPVAVVLLVLAAAGSAWRTVAESRRRRPAAV